MDDFGNCLVSNSRMAARAVTRRYDAALRPHGVTSTQLSLLGAIKTLPDRTVSDIAEARGFERTTLTRNLDRLEAMGLIASRAAERGNGRIPAITVEGEAMLKQLVPLWRQAQADMQAELGKAGFDDALRMLKTLATL